MATEPELTDKQKIALADLVCTYVHDGRTYAVPSRWADGDSGWADSWYVLDGDGWVPIDTDDVPEEVYDEHSPY